MSRNQVMKLYRNLIRESKKFPAYNYRCYALRRIRDNFKEHKDLTDENVIASKIQEGNTNLEIIKRQVIIGHMYSTDKLVIENVQQQQQQQQQQRRN